jgi:hypothetical protein
MSSIKQSWRTNRKTIYTFSRNKPEEVPESQKDGASVLFHDGIILSQLDSWPLAIASTPPKSEQPACKSGHPSPCRRFSYLYKSLGAGKDMFEKMAV